MDHVSYPPSRHTEYLRKGKDVRDAVILVSLATREAMTEVFIEELVVGLVGYKPCVVYATQLDQAVYLMFRPHIP